MSLRIDIDPNGMSTPVSFAEMRTRLLGLGHRFEARYLHRLSYAELPLAAMANAGAARCSPADVREAKELRRYRFETMDPALLRDCYPYLASKGMAADVWRGRRRRRARQWADLSLRARIWFKLNCLYTHFDAPHDRLHEAAVLVQAAGTARQLSSEVTTRMLHRIDQLLWMFPDAMDGDSFRATLGMMAEEMLTLLDESEREACQEAVLSDYSCTSDCYHVTGLPE